MMQYEVYQGVQAAILGNIPSFRLLSAFAILQPPPYCTHVEILSILPLLSYSTTRTPKRPFPYGYRRTLALPSKYLPLAPRALFPQSTETRYRLPVRTATVQYSTRCGNWYRYCPPQYALHRLRTVAGAPPSVLPLPPQYNSYVRIQCTTLFRR